MVTLTFVLEDGEEVVVPLSGLVTLGRDDDNDVIIDDERISRHHAELSLLPDGRVEVSDLGSTGGTFVNGRPARKQIVKPGDKLAFGPLAADIVVTDDADVSAVGKVDDSAWKELQASITKEEKRLAELKAESDKTRAAADESSKALKTLKSQQSEIEAAVRKLEEARAKGEGETKDLLGKQELETKRLRNLRDDVAVLEKQLQDLSLMADEQKKRADQSAADLDRAIQKKRDELSRLDGEAAEARKTLERLQQEIAARNEELGTRSRAVEQLAARTGEMEEGARVVAEAQRKAANSEERVVAVERERDEARRAAADAASRVSALESELQKALKAADDSKAEVARLQQQKADAPKPSAQMELSGINAEAAREELSTLEARLTPLRDWKKDMERRHAKLSQVAAGSAEERELNREIDDAYGELADLLPAARIETAGLARGDFSRMRAKSGVPMKSDRIRRA